MTTVVLRVETELDPSAAPRIFGYLGGLGHVPVQAVLRHSAGGLLIEVRIESESEAAGRILAKLEQMPFVLTSTLVVPVGASSEGSPGASEEPSNGGITKLNITGGMQHAPLYPPSAGWMARGSGIDAASLRLAATQRMHAIRHRTRQLNA